jgi:hypothetical protein
MESVIRELSKKKAFLGNIHLDEDAFFRIKSLIDKDAEYIASTEKIGTVQDFLKDKRNEEKSLIFGLARKFLRKCYKCMNSKDFIVCDEIIPYLIELSEFIHQMKGLVLDLNKIQEVEKEVTTHLTSFSTPPNNEDADHAWE